MRVALLALSCAACSSFGTTAPPPAADAGPPSAVDAGAETPAPEPVTIVWRGTSTAVAASPPAEETLRIPPVAGAVEGDTLLAAIAVGDNSDTFDRLPIVAPPPGWAEVLRADVPNVTTMIAYVKRAGAAETTSTWTANRVVTGVGFIAAYAGVDGEEPVAASAPLIQRNGAGTTYEAPSIDIGVPGAMLLTAFFAKGPGGGATPGITLQPGTTVRGSIDNGGTRALAFGDVLLSAPTSTEPRTATMSIPLEHGLSFTLALNPQTR